MSTVTLAWWPEKPVLEARISGAIKDRNEALDNVKTMVAQLEQCPYQQVIVVIDLSELGNSPSAGALLATSLPQTNRIAHLVFIKTPPLFRMAALPLLHLRDRLHFMDNATAAKDKIAQLLPKLRP
jgi:hypothetical protein